MAKQRKSKPASKRLREAVLALCGELKKRGTSFLHVRVVDESARGKPRRGKKGKADG